MKQFPKNILFAYEIKIISDDIAVARLNYAKLGYEISKSYVDMMRCYESNESALTTIARDYKAIYEIQRNSSKYQIKAEELLTSFLETCNKNGIVNSYTENMRTLLLELNPTNSVLAKKPQQVTLKKVRYVFHK